MKKLFLLAITLLSASCTTRSPITATGVSLTEMKSGKVCLHNVLNYFDVAGHHDIAGAAAKAGIKHIAVVDQEVRNFFVYKQTCTIVYGV